MTGIMQWSCLFFLDSGKAQGAGSEWSRFSGRDLRDADFSRANLISTHCEDARFAHAILRDVNLSGARLNDADFSDAQPIGAKLTRQQFDSIKFMGGLVCFRRLSISSLSDED